MRLDDQRAVDGNLTGGKAAALAKAAASGLAILPGGVLTTSYSKDIDAGADIRTHHDFREAVQLTDHWSGKLVVRSSSVVEDMADSSQAGQFESVIGIEGVDELSEAVATVLESRERAGAVDRPIAVLIQPFVQPAFGGVLFGVDPVTGRTDRRVVTAVEGQPDSLVRGEVDGSRYVIDSDGSIVHCDRGDGPELPADLLVALLDLSDSAAEVFDHPQDVEWAVVDGELLLLQSRPVTTEIRGAPRGPLYGPGPVAETFPEPLSTLEAALWIPPLRDAVEQALRLAAAAPPGHLHGEPDLVVVVDGYAAIDLERTGEAETGSKGRGGRGVVRRLRRLRSAWRVGRLRSALPALGERVVRRVDDDLESMPSFASMTDRQLVALLGRSRQALRSLHAHEILMGLLADTSQLRLTGASVAMRVLTEARTEGRPDAEIIANSPVVLSLTGPRISAGVELPDECQTPYLPPAPSPSPARVQAAHQGETDAGIVREALRIRVRWVQELGARAAWELGERLTRLGRLPSTEHVRWLTLDDLIAVVTRRSEVVFDVLCHHANHRPEPSPLPARFRISDMGRPVAERTAGTGDGGTGAGGGRRSGVVTHDVEDPPPGSVLVVTSLTPEIGPLLGRLHGVVAETGSVLAHLAILAREAGVPTVVGYGHAVQQFVEGQTVTVDGNTGDVIPAGESEPPGQEENA